MRRIPGVCLLAAALAIAAWTPPARSVAASQPSAKVFPFAYSIDDLPNGLRVVIVPTPFPNIVALYTVVRAGSRNEVEPGKSGFAHLFEHLMFRGTEKFPPEKWEAVMQAAGAQTNAYTTDDRTVYHEVFAKESLDPVLMAEGDRFQNLKYSEAAFKTETRAVLGEYNKNSSTPSSSSSRRSRTRPSRASSAFRQPQNRRSYVPPPKRDHGLFNSSRRG